MMTFQHQSEVNEDSLMMLLIDLKRIYSNAFVHFIVIILFNLCFYYYRNVEKKKKKNKNVFQNRINIS